MIDDDVRGTVDRLWDAFWSGGISNPLEVIEQITYLMFLRRMEDLQTAKERKATRTRKPIENPLYSDETDQLRWSRFKELDPASMFELVRDEVFKWLRELGADSPTYSPHMKDARFTIPTAALLTEVVDMLDDIPLAERDAKGDVYEYMLSKIETAGQNGQFRTPRHIIQLMVEMMAPGPKDEICDPACGTAGFLVAAAEYVSRTHHDALLDVEQRRHFNQSMFHGFDLDSTMLRIASMNMLQHDIEQPDIRYRDSLAQSAATEAELYSLILANPPFAGSSDNETTAKDLLDVVKTQKTELLFLALFLRLLKPGGRAAVIVPDGVLFGSTKAHKELRKLLVEGHKLDAVVKLPSGVFKPYAGVSTAILFFTKTNRGGTDNVWFYDVTADGFSLDDRRTPLLPEGRLGARTATALEGVDHAKNNLPDVLARWSRRNGSEQQRDRTEQSFCVPKADIAAQDYNLSLNHYRKPGTSETNTSELRLADIAQILVGQIPQAATKEVTPAIEKNVLFSEQLSNPLPLVEDLRKCEIAAVSSATTLHGGDIVGSLATDVRSWRIIPSHYAGVLAGDNIVVIRISKHIISAEYLIAFLSSSHAWLQLWPSSDTAQLELPRLRSLVIPECDGDTDAIRAALIQISEGIDQANRAQNELTQARMEVFAPGKSSERRRRLEQVADRSALIAEGMRRYDDPYKIFQETYPYAIARAVRKYRHSLTLNEKYEAANQCAETLVISLGIISLATAIQAGRKSLDQISEWRNSLVQGVSLGHWAAVVRDASKDHELRSTETTGLTEAAASKKGGKGLLADLNELVVFRNKISHGLRPRTSAEIEVSLNELDGILLRSLTASTFLAKLRWVFVEGISWQEKAQRFTVSGHLLMGDHPDFEHFQFDNERPLEGGSLYLLTPQRDVIATSPFCGLNDCNKCLTRELYYPDRLTRTTTARLKSLDRGHELESEDIATKISELFEG